MDWFGICFNGISIAVQAVLHIYFAGRLTGKKLKAWHYTGYLLALSAIEGAAGAAGINELAIGAELLALWGINRLALKNSPFVSGVTAVLAVYVSQLSFGMVNSLEILFFQNVIGRTLLLHVLLVLAAFLSFVICLCCYLLILNHFSLREDIREPYIWMLAPPVLFFFAAEQYILHTAYGRTLTVPYQVQTGKQTALFLLQALGLTALFCSLYAYRCTCRSFQAQASLDSLRRETHACKIYLEQAQMRYGLTKAFRHDIKNHMTVLGGLLKSGKLEQAENYLQKLQAVTAELSFPFHTGNTVADILLADKARLAEADGTEVEITVVLPEKCGIDSMDLCVIFANALDNAVRACRQAEGGKRIRVAGERQGDFFLLQFENTCAPGPVPSMGTGLSNIKAVAEKYGGAVTAGKSGGLFQLDILLDLSVHPDDSSTHIS